VCVRVGRLATPGGGKRAVSRLASSSSSSSRGLETAFNRVYCRNKERRMAASAGGRVREKKRTLRDALDLSGNGIT